MSALLLAVLRINTQKKFEKFTIEIGKFCQVLSKGIARFALILLLHFCGKSDNLRLSTTTVKRESPYCKLHLKTAL